MRFEGSPTYKVSKRINEECRKNIGAVTAMVGNIRC
jgi:hypothetical protein